MAKKTKEGKNLSLTVMDRVVAANLYPERADFLTQLLVRDIRKKLDFTQDDVKKYEIKTNERGFTSWKKGGEMVVNLTEAELYFLKERVKVLDKEKIITADMVPLCVKLQGE